MSNYKFCPECGIGLSSIEQRIRHCQNCKAYWDEDEGSDFDDEEDDFEPCSVCDLPDACADFGCAIKSGIRKNYPIDGIF
jgi:hypothetical protein